MAETHFRYRVLAGYSGSTYTVRGLTLTKNWYYTGVAYLPVEFDQAAALQIIEIQSVSTSLLGPGYEDFGAPTVLFPKTFPLFAFPSVSAIGTVNDGAHTVAITVPFGTAVTALVASFSYNGSAIAISATPQVSGVTANNFTSPVVYTITGTDGTTQTVTVTVTVANNPAKDFTVFSFDAVGAVGIVDTVAQTVTVTVPNGTALTALVASFTGGASVKVGATSQTTGVTTNDFTNPVVYTITAADTTTKTFTVSVVVASTSSKVLQYFAVTSPVAAVGVISEATHSVEVSVPNGTTVTTMVAQFGKTGASLKIGATTQTTKSTANNFTSPQLYIVTAQDATTIKYTVTVTILP